MGVESSEKQIEMRNMVVNAIHGGNDSNDLNNNYASSHYKNKIRDPRLLRTPAFKSDEDEDDFYQTYH